MAHVETGSQVGLNDLVPLFESHLVHGPVTRDTGIVDQYLDRTDIAFDGLYRRLAGFVITDIEAVGWNACIGSELVRCLFVTRIGGNDRVTRILQCQADGFADTPGAACY